MRIRVAIAVLLAAVLGSSAVASAQTLESSTNAPMNVKPTDKCPQTDVDQMEKVITFVQGQSWSEHPGNSAFSLSPDTANCRVVLKIHQVTSVEQAALERGGEGRLAIQKTKDYGKPSRLPLLLWVVFGGAGVVFVFVRYGRR